MQKRSTPLTDAAKLDVAQKKFQEMQVEKQKNIPPEKDIFV